MIKVTSIPSAIALAAVTLLVAGCGSGDDSTLSRAELLKRADAICGKVHEKNLKDIYAYLRKHDEEFSTVGSPRARAALGRGYLAVTVPVLRQGTKEFEALAASSDEEQKIETFVAAMDKTIKAIEENPESKRATSPFLYRETHKLGRAYDFGRCRELP